MSFGCTFIGKGPSKYVLVSGGYSAGRKAVADCEIYNTNDNLWTAYAPMVSQRASHSLLMTENAKWVYAFGGVGVDEAPLNTIERIKIDSPSAPDRDVNSSWVLLDV